MDPPTSRNRRGRFSRTRRVSGSDANAVGRARLSSLTSRVFASRDAFADIGFPHDGFDLVGEDDEEDLLCDFAPSAMQSDGGFGLVSADGRVSLPVSPSVRAAGAGGSLLASHASLSIEDSMTYRHPATGEPCLSDSWHAGDFAARSGGFADASITSLRRRYRHVFGKETSSNNRQWLLRRLAEINEYGARLGGDEYDEYAVGDDSGDFRSGDGSDDAGDSSPFTDGSGSAGTHADFFGAGDSAQMAHGRRASVSKLDTAGRGAMRHAYAAGRKGKRRSSDSHSTEGDAAKTDASAAGKKRRGGHHSDSDEHHEGGESPVKSSRGAGAGRGNARGNSGKGSPRGRDGVGANGRRSKHHNPWALEEAEALVDGVARCGGGKWADIKKLGFPAIEHRTAVDLKDKWRNLLRIAMLPHQPAKSAGDKKREIPAELLARVRDLAAKQAKKAAADGRSRVGGR